MMISRLRAEAAYVLAVALLSVGLVSLAASCGSSEEPPAADSTASDPQPGLVGHILFTRTTDQRGDVQTIETANADGSGQRRLTERGEFCCLVRISPDHARILVMPGEDPPPNPITGGTLSIEGSDFTRLAITDPTLNLVPGAWSPDGKRIAFEGWDEADPGRTGVYTARASDFGDVVRVTNSAGHPHDIPLDYSPDGTQLVFYRAVRAEPDFPVDIGGSLWVVNVDGSGAQHLETPGTTAGPWARWSPDGTKLLFGAERLQRTGAVWSVRPNGADFSKVFEDPGGRYASGPTWSPDGQQIMFVLNPTNDSFSHLANELYVINADGSGLKLVIGGSGHKSSPEWWR